MSAGDLKNLCATELIALCAANTTDAKLWSEFLRRFAPKVRFFVRRTLRSVINGSAYLAEGPPTGIDHESDLFQSTILRLVDRDCAVMRRFRGTCERDFVVYLAALTESVVRDCLRRQRILKRPCATRRVADDGAQGANGTWHTEPVAEQQVLASELRRLSIRALRTLSGRLYRRDRKIFELCFSRGLSVYQIASLIGLSKTAVEYVLNRLKARVRAMVSGSPAERDCEKPQRRFYEF